MTLRRRFFPSRTAQQVPGQTVQVEVQLRPEATAAAPAASASADGCACDADGVAWFSDWSGWSEGEWGASVWSVQRAVASGATYSDETWQWTADRLVAGYAEINNEVTQVWRAVVLGRTLCDVQWTWADDASGLPAGAQWAGLVVEQVGASLRVSVGPGWPAGGSDAQWWGELTATATCGGETVGTLILRPGFNLWVAPLPAIEGAGP
ncbi:hypothetical protein [Ottowia sp.]|uniref:hypothetical protein n=1 Tax=Ottowia sp. TaxID=1898956 RepID=UPI003A848420